MSRGQGFDLAHVLVVELPGRPRGEDMFLQGAGEEGMHPADGIAEGHRAESVAVVAAPDGQHPRPSRPGLEAHLQGHFHGDRTGIGEEHVLKRLGGHLDQTLGELDRRRVGEAAEHHV